MIKQKRLIRIETSLTPKQAVLFWLRREHQGKTSSEYVQWMLHRPPSAAPRTRVEGQVVDAIRVAMKGQEPSRIHQAIRKGQMYADFLILLVSRTNTAILDDSRPHWLQIALLYEQLRNAALSNDEEKTAQEWAVRLKRFATELLSLQRATALIRDQYFDGECILFKDVLEDLEQQTRLVKGMMHTYDQVVIGAGKPKLAIDSDAFRNIVADLAWQKAGLIINLAKSKMLNDFGESDAADAILKSIFSEANRGQTTFGTK